MKKSVNFSKNSFYKIKQALNCEGTNHVLVIKALESEIIEQDATTDYRPMNIPISNILWTFYILLTSGPISLI